MSRPSAIVTGGGTGIGRAVAAALLAGDHDVTIAGRRREVLEAAAAQLRDQRPAARIETASVDVGRPDGPAELVAQHVERFGGIDAMVTCAAIYEPVGFLDITPESWERTMSINLRGAVLCAVEAARHMARAGRGRIVLIGSTSAFHSEAQNVLYGTSKAALGGVARSIAVDLAGTGVVGNVVAPGWTYTEMAAADVDRLGTEGMRQVNPLARAGRPEEIAEVVRYLVVDAPEYLTGQTIYVDGGQTVVAPLP